MNRQRVCINRNIFQFKSRYDDNGDCIEEKEYEPFSGNDESGLNKYKKYRYNQKNELVEEIYINTFDPHTGWIWSGKYCYEYSEDGKLLCEEKLEIKNTDGQENYVPVYKHEYQYTGNDLILKYYSYNRNSGKYKLSSTNQISFLYDNNGNLIKVEYSIDNETIFNIDYYQQ